MSSEFGKRRRLTQIRQAGPLRVSGVAWQWDADAGTWRRYLMRRHTRSGELDVTGFARIDPAQPFCMACCSHEVGRRARGVPVCRHCGLSGALWLP